MPSLREIKDRIGSVKSTLKITSAMKLVASSKLRKAQKAVETLRPYSEALGEILGEATGRSENPAACPRTTSLCSSHRCAALAVPPFTRPRAATVAGDNNRISPSARPVAIVAVSSNSSLCGGFNENVIKKTLELAREIGNVEVFPIGRKMAEAVRKNGLKVVEDLSDMVAHPSYDQAAALSKRLAKAFEKDQYSEVLLVYNHFVSTARQEVLVESFLSAPASDGSADSADTPAGNAVNSEEIYIIEPGREEVEEALRPKVLSLRIFSMILDSVAAEQAARTVAMQTATDNAQDLLADLTLEYNKGRQQKITAEILDLVAGSAN